MLQGHLEARLCPDFPIDMKTRANLLLSVAICLALSCLGFWLATDSGRETLPASTSTSLKPRPGIDLSRVPELSSRSAPQGNQIKEVLARVASKANEFLIAWESQSLVPLEHTPQLIDLLSGFENMSLEASSEAPVPEDAQRVSYLLPPPDENTTMKLRRLVEDASPKNAITEAAFAHLLAELHWPETTRAVSAVLCQEGGDVVTVVDRIEFGTRPTDGKMVISFEGVTTTTDGETAISAKGVSISKVNLDAPNRFSHLFPVER